MFVEIIGLRGDVFRTSMLMGFDPLETFIRLALLTLELAIFFNFEFPSSASLLFIWLRRLRKLFSISFPMI